MAYLHEFGELALDFDILQAASPVVVFVEALVCIDNIIAFKCHSFVINSAAFSNICPGSLINLSADCCVHFRFDAVSSSATAEELLRWLLSAAGKASCSAVQLRGQTDRAKVRNTHQTLPIEDRRPAALL